MSDNITHFQHDESYVAGPELWKHIAAFAYGAPDVRFAFAGAREAILGLAGWLLLTLCLALDAARRLRPL